MSKKLQLFINGTFVQSETSSYTDVYDPSTGEVIAQTPHATAAEVEQAVQAAKKAFPVWKGTPLKKRVELMGKLLRLIDENMEELTQLCAREHGKTYGEAKGDVLKAREMTELAMSAPNLLMGEALQDTSKGYDTVLVREPLGIFAGIAPWNFPAMIPMGWMTPLAVVCGNTFILKPASTTPMTCLRMAELYKEAGFPDGVLNVIPCADDQAERIVTHPDVKGVTFVGSTRTGRHVYKKAAEAGKRVQALCQAKNHALILRDTPIEETASRVVNAAFGCAGERCMALSVVVVEECIADDLVNALVRQCKTQTVGPAYDKATKLGPVGSKRHLESIHHWIAKGIEEGAQLVLDGRSVRVPGYESGFYLGHTILDHVKPGMTVGDEEIFGPVLCIKRVRNFEEGIALMNANPYANGSVIFTQNGYYAREFVTRTDGGMVGVNVGIPVPIGPFPFSGHKQSFFGDLHCHGKDAFRFYTESKTVTTYWMKPEQEEQVMVDAWGR